MKEIPRSYTHLQMLRELEEQRRDPARYVTLAEVFEWPRPPRKRFPVVRDPGTRVQLPKWLRIAVLKRDDFCCKFCDAINTRFEIDHIIPWSAGGPDASWNLRTLCHDCNQRRSNYNERCSRWAMPIVPTCVECSARAAGIDQEDGTGAWEEFVEAYHPWSQINTAWCDRCCWFTNATLVEIDRAPHQTMDWSRAVAA